MREDICRYISENRALLYETHSALCHIPAPSHAEQARAAYCKAWLERAGATGVYIDEADNVIFALGCEGSSAITAIAAHTDTVFPDTEPLPFTDDGERIYCPGAADDTAGVAVLLLTAKYYIDRKILPQEGLLFVCNSGEEGLGNLKGVRRLFAAYGRRITQFITLDSQLDCISDRCVGSRRYRVRVTTKGGHSFSSFGNANAIARLSELIGRIYALDVPEKAGTHTTYNVGTVSGGTSVNTIAQDAEMLCEYRSDDAACLQEMERRFSQIFQTEWEDAQLCVTEVGERPCSRTDQAAISALKAQVVPVIESVIGAPVSCRSASTDCNIPLSLGIPALCIGVARYAGTHTREEWVDKASMLTGLEVCISVARALTEK